MSGCVRAALLLVVFIAACGRATSAESPLAHRVEDLEEHGFQAREVEPQGDPLPEETAVVELEGATATIYAYRTQKDAQQAASVFAAEEQASPDRVRVQREGLNVYVGRAVEGGKLPAVDFEDVVFTAEEEHG
jgi:hypothetical protein